MVLSPQYLSPRFLNLDTELDLQVHPQPCSSYLDAPDPQAMVCPHGEHYYSVKSCLLPLRGVLRNVNFSAAQAQIRVLHG